MRYLRDLILIIMMVFTCASCQYFNMGKKQPVTPPEQQPAQPQEQAQSPEKAPAPGNAFTITTFIDGKNTINVTNDGGKWSASSGGKNFSVEADGTGKFILSDGTATIADGPMDAEGLRLKTPEGVLYARLKIKDDKIKIYQQEDGVPWELKFKENKIKVSKAEKEIGSVKYKPETGKVKAKIGEQEIAESKDLGRVTAALSPFIMDDMDNDHKIFLALVFLTMNK